MSRKARIKPDEAQRIREMRAQSLTLSEIKERTGRSLSAIYKVVKEKQPEQIENEHS